MRSFWNALPQEKRPQTAKAFARELVAANKLTSYQVTVLRSGKTKELVLGHYVILDRIGDGGMGQVFLARHRMMRRLVALKMLRKHGAASEAEIDRFRREIRAIAKLDEHPNIVTAFDADIANGIHFLAMQYVVGQDLSSLVKTHGPLAVGQAVAYASQAAHGLGHAHDHGVIHRDVKPSNLLVDERNTVKVLDLGLAWIRERDEEEQLDQSHSLTEFGQIMGTVDYIAPEQAKDTLSADRRSDIYSLGCTLYWMLTGTPPYRGKTTAETLLRHQTAEVPSPRSRRRDVGVQLDDVVRKMLAKDPDDRQQSMAQVISELAATVRDPADGSFDSRQEAPGDHRLAEFLRLVAEPTTSVRHKSRMIRDTSTAGMGHEETRTASHPGTVSAPVGARRCSRTALAAGLGLLGLIAFGAYWMIPAPRPDPPLPAPRYTLQLEATLNPRTGIVRSMSFSGDGRRVAAAEGSVLRFWDLDQGVGGPPLFGHAGPITSVDFGHHDRSVATAGEDGTIRIWNSETGTELSCSTADCGPLRCVVYSPRGNRLASGSDDGSVLLWELPPPPEARRLGGHGAAVLTVAFSGDGKTLASADANGVIRIWDTETLEARAEMPGHSQPVTSLAFLPGDKRLVSGAGGPERGEIMLWDLEKHERLKSCSKDYSILSLCPCQKGKQLAVAARENEWGRVALIELEPYNEQPLTPELPMDVLQVALAPDDNTLGVSFADGSMQVWNLASRQKELEFCGNSDATFCLALSPDGRTLASGGPAGVIKLWDRSHKAELVTLRKIHHSDVRAISFSKDGRRLVSTSLDGKIVLWDMGTKTVARVLGKGNHSPVYAAMFSPDGSKIVSGGGQWHESGMYIWDVETGNVARELTGHDDVVASVAYSPDGRTIASGSYDNTVKVWDAAVETPPRTVDQRHHWVSSVAFSPDGSKLASGGHDYLIHLSDLNTGQTLELVGHSGPVTRVVFSADGSHLFSTGHDKAIRIWNADTGIQEQCIHVRHAELEHCFVFSRERRVVASSSRDGTIKLWTISSTAPGLP